MQLVWAGPSNLLLRHERLDPGVAVRADATDILGLPPDTSPLTGPEPRGGHLVHAVIFDTESGLDRDARDLSQSWVWPDAGGTLDRCRYRVTVAQLVGRRRDCPERVQAFRAVVDATVTLARPLATWWPASCQALPPGALASHPLTGVVNVRVFRSVHDPALTVTDTLGLHSLGLPDLQCQSRNLNTERLGEVLFELAEYVLKHGDVLRPGIPVPGLSGEQQFLPSRGPSIVPPNRVVTDLDPGAGYQA